MKTTAGNIKKGDFIIHQDEIWQVQKTDFNFQGRGMAVVRMKVKSVASGKNVDLSSKSVDTMETADVSTVEMQFLYKDEAFLHFMNEQNYSQISLPAVVVGPVASYLKVGAKYYVLMYDDTPLNIRPPASVRLKVTEATNAVKGDTVSGAKKEVTVETGTTVMAPLFIKTGDTIAVNPETGQYVERVND